MLIYFSSLNILKILETESVIKFLFIEEFVQLFFYGGSSSPLFACYAMC